VSFPNTPEGYSSYRMVTSISKPNAAGEAQIASCTASIYVNYPSSKHVVERISGYGSDIAQHSIYNYDAFSGYLISKTSPYGAFSDYAYDERGRIKSCHLICALKPLLKP